MPANQALEKQFVSPPQPVRDVHHAEFGALAVILRNNKVDRVVRRGSRIGRGWNAPWTGQVSVIQVNTGLIGFTMDIPTIPTRDLYRIRSVQVSVEVTLNDSDGYAAFEHLVDRIGPTFGRGLAIEVDNAVEALVRSRLGSFTHDELYGTALAPELGANHTPFPIGNGVLQLMHIGVGAVEWDPIYTETREQGALTNLVHARTTVATAQVQQDATVQGARIEALRPLALELGVDPWLLADPDRRREVEGRAFELTMTLLKPENRVLLSRNPGLMDSVQAFFPSIAPGFGSGPAAAPIAAEPVPAIDAVAAPEVGPSPVPVPRTPPPAGPMQAGAHHRVPELTVDQRLARVWRAIGLPSHALLGLGSATVGEAGAVVVVTDPPFGPGQLTDAPSALAPVLRAGSVRVLALPAAPVGAVVQAWVRAVLGDAEAADLSLDVHEETQGALDVLVVEVSAVDARAAVRRLTDPADPALAALEAVLPYALLDVRLGAS